MTRLFGTDGVRGIANVEPMTPQTIMRLGFAAGSILRDGVPWSQPVTCVVGRDTRLSGPMIGSALASGLVSAGVRVLVAGIVPTPAISVLTRHLSAQAGAVISASHNPYGDNGVKFFSAAGDKLPDDREDQIVERLKTLEGSGLAEQQSRVGADHIGWLETLDGAVDIYCAWARAAFGPGSLAGWRIVVDCAHGAAYRTTPRVLTELGAQIIALNVAPDGRNINAGCGSLHLEGLQQAVRAHGARLGISHDGDADRAILVDETGAIVDGDAMLGIMARHWAAAGRLPGQGLVTTVMTNLGLEMALLDLGIKMHRAKVGDRYVKELMDREKLILGGEQSGHIILSDHAPTGDGLLTALSILRVMTEDDRPLSQLHAFIRRFPQVLVNVRVSSKPPLESLPGVSDAVAAVEGRLGSAGRVLLRYSGTESLMRVMVEGPPEADVQAMADQIASAVADRIGAQ